MALWDQVEMDGTRNHYAAAPARNESAKGATEDEDKEESVGLECHSEIRGTWPRRRLTRQ